MLAAAAAADQGLARAFGYLLDASQPADPTPALAAALFELPGPPPGPRSALVRWLLAAPVVAGRDAFACTTGWRADALLLPALRWPDTGRGTTRPSIDRRLVGWREGPRRAAAAWPVLRPEALGRILGLVQRLAGQGEGTTPSRSNCRTARVGPHDAGRAGRRPPRPPADRRGRGRDQWGADFALAATREARRARLEGALLAWEHADAVPTRASPPLRGRPLTFISVRRRGEPGKPAVRLIRRSIRCGQIGRRERIALWTSLTAAPVPPAVGEWALRPAEIGVAAQRGAGRRAGGSRELPAPADGRPTGAAQPGAAVLSRGAISSSRPATAAHLRELEAQARDRGQVLDDWGFGRLTPLGRGVTALFAGPSGTGKTMAAQVLARSLGPRALPGRPRRRRQQVHRRDREAPARGVRRLRAGARAAPVRRGGRAVRAGACRSATRTTGSPTSRSTTCCSAWSSSTASPSSPRTARATSTRRSCGGCASSIDFAPPSRRRARAALAARAGGRHATPTGGRSPASSTGAGLARELDLTGAGDQERPRSRPRSSPGPTARGSTTRHVLAAARRELEKQGIVVRPASLEPR